MEYREPETIIYVIDGVKLKATYLHNKDWNEVKDKMVKILLNDELSKDLRSDENKIYR